MKMDILDVYRLLMICKLHFTTEKYNCLKSKSISNLQSRYDRLPDHQKRIMAQLAKKFNEPKEYTKFLVANFLKGSDPRFTPIPQCMEIAKKYNSRKESLRYRIELELEEFGKLQNIDYHRLLQDYESDLISPETILLYDYFYKFLDSLYNSIEYVGYKDTILALQKYRTFFNTEKYHELFKKSTGFSS